MTGVALVDDASADDGVVDSGIANCLRWNAGEIAIDDDDIGQLPRSKRAFVFLVKCRVSCIDGVGAKCIFDRNFLLGYPAAWILVVEGATGDRGVDPLQWRRRRNRPIAAEREPGTGLPERAKCVSRLRAFVADDFLCPPPIIDGVVRLHTGYHAKLPEASDVLWRDVLRVLDAKAAIAGAILTCNTIEDVQLEIDCAVADRVNDDVQFRF